MERVEGMEGVERVERVVEVRGGVFFTRVVARVDPLSASVFRYAV